MNIRDKFYHHLALVILSVFLVLIIGFYFAWEPLSRQYVATDAVCTHCHVEQEYLYSARNPFTKPHPQESEDSHTPALCLDCHMPEGFWNTIYLYTHIVSITDMFGHFRDREGERSGDWIPMSAARAFRVRERLFEYNSSTCRSCHVEAETIPESIRGQTAHKDALANGETCIECHSNLVHRFVEVRVPGDADTDDTEEDMDAVDEFDEFGEESEDGLEVL